MSTSRAFKYCARNLSNSHFVVPILREIRLSFIASQIRYRMSIASYVRGFLEKKNLFTAIYNWEIGSDWGKKNVIACVKVFPRLAVEFGCQAIRNAVNGEVSSIDLDLARSCLYL